MAELLSGQAEIINRGVNLDLPLGQDTVVLGLPVKFSADMRLSFSKVVLKGDELTQLVPDAVVGDGYNYNRALVVKLANRPMLAICTGLDKSDYLDNDRPIAAVFNLLHPDEQEWVTVEGWQLFNNDNPVGGMDLSDRDVSNDVLEVNAVQDAINLTLTEHVRV